MDTIYIKRIYDEPSDKDGYRVLVDRLWPRGISKKDANLDEWNKEIAPSTELRKWFSHREAYFEEFEKRYRAELEAKQEELSRLKDLAKTNTVTLLYGAKNTKINQAVVLRNLLLNRS
ncbi:MAG: DUF488 domain-containing protein [Flavobacteriaceae bacterium]|nr:DUF488 domain-containing protein [Flavobacteriaceae bacterium]